MIRYLPRFFAQVADIVLAVIVAIIALECLNKLSLPIDGNLIPLWTALALGAALIAIFFLVWGLSSISWLLLRTPLCMGGRVIVFPLSLASAAIVKFGLDNSGLSLSGITTALISVMVLVVIEARLEKSLSDNSGLIYQVYLKKLSWLIFIAAVLVVSFLFVYSLLSAHEVVGSSQLMDKAKDIFNSLDWFYEYA